MMKGQAIRTINKGDNDKGCRNVKGASRRGAAV